MSTVSGAAVRTRKRFREAVMQDPSSGLIRVAVLSDSHGLLRREVIAELQDCSHILHAGDIIRETDLDELNVYGSLYAVLGNNDVYMPWSGRLKAVLRFTIGGVRFLMTHERWDVPRDLSGVDVVVYGHTHRFAQENIDGRLWLNPGSCGPSRFGSEASMAKLDIKSGRILRVCQILI